MDGVEVGRYLLLVIEYDSLRGWTSMGVHWSPVVVVVVGGGIHLLSSVSPDPQQPISSTKGCAVVLFME